jgi:hypothetical protein
MEDRRMTEPGFIINGTRYPLPSSLTAGEAFTVKQHFGLDVEDFADDVKGKGTERMLGMLWIVMHRADPSVTPQDVMAVDLAAIEEDTPPTAADEKAESSDPPTGGVVGGNATPTRPGLEMIRASSGSQAS